MKSKNKYIKREFTLVKNYNIGHDEEKQKFSNC